MSCNCGKHNVPHVAPPGHDCNHINHVFDPNPPAFYGTWKHMSGFDPSGKVSVCTPGIDSGLYTKCGPLNCTCKCGSLYTLTGVKTSARIVVDITMNYADSTSVTVTITPGEVYMFTYLEEGELKDCCGLVTSIYKVETLESKTNLYKIRVDCSSSYGSNVVVFKTDQIRMVEKYKAYMFESSKLSNCTAQSGTAVSAIIRDAIVVNAELDSNNNFIKGDIIYGVLENGKLVNCTVEGENDKGHVLMLVDAVCHGGEIVSGKILNGILKSGDVDGIVDEDTGISTGTARGTITNAVILKAKTTGGYTEEGEGTLIDPIIEGTLYESTITGDIVTTGGVTIGDVTTGGVTVGGTATGGTAVGYINGKMFKITGGTTTGTLHSVGGTVVGGVISGGTRVGNAIYGATVTGGTLTGGITTGGTTSGGKIEPVEAGDIRVAETPVEPATSGKRPYRDDCLLVGKDKTTDEPWTNIATTNMEKLEIL